MENFYRWLTVLLLSMIFCVLILTANHADHYLLLMCQQSGAKSC